jgi:hypothetical protein
MSATSSTVFSDIRASGQPSLALRDALAGDGRERGRVTADTAGRGAPEAVSDSGSETGAAGRRQVLSEAVTVPGQTSLNCRYALQQRLCQVVRSVRIEGSDSPPSSIRRRQVSARISVIGQRFLPCDVRMGAIREAGCVSIGI